jgi:hypothetical protein
VQHKIVVREFNFVHKCNKAIYIDDAGLLHCDAVSTLWILTLRWDILHSYSGLKT